MTDPSGQKHRTHEHRGLKGRTRGRPSTRARKPSRRIFRSERGNPIQASTWWQVWQKVRAASLTPEQLDGPLMIQPYCLRHAGVTRRLNEGVDEATVAAWGRALSRSAAPDLPSLSQRPGRGPDRADGRAPEAIVMGTEAGTGRHRLAERVTGWHRRDSQLRR